MTKPPPGGISAELTAAVSDRFTELFDGCGAYLGASGERRVTSVLKSVSLRGSRKIEDLAALPVLADLAGRTDVFLGCVEALRPVPWTGDYSIYEPIRQLFCGAMRRAELSGMDPAPYRSMITLPETGSPGDPSSTSELKSRATGDVWKRLLAGTEPGDRTGAYGLAVTCMEVLELYVAWALGGSFRFSRKKIDGEIDIAAGWLREMRAIR
ncbi:MAG: hypothetical protein WKF57_01730 [Nakamurella sp.]